MLPRRAGIGARLLAAALLLALVACSGDPYPQSTLHPSADASRTIDGLYRQIVVWATVVFVVVQAVLIVALIRFRRRPGQPEPRQVYGNTFAEVTWTLAPAVILVFIAVPTIQTIFRVAGQASPDAVQVEVVGHQWWWEFRYPELGVVTANELHLPQGREAALAITSADVIHSFWAPKLHGKRDAQPGRTTRLAFTPDSVGTYLGQCAEFCGESHANMRLRVIVESPADFEAWAVRQAQPAAVDSGAALEVAGLEAFRRVRDPGNHTCIICHTIEGVSGGLAGPNLTHLGSRQTIAGGILPNDSAGLARWLRDPPGEKPGSLMPKIALTDDEIAALVAYLRSRQ
ncbi:MAG TPA: cytochrome c oxidase subunit II [Gemmatimonadales bacterium]|nr:cytochrome c oxidase subunit II [Gemmatimonadales bacterium]